MAQILRPHLYWPLISVRGPPTWRCTSGTGESVLGGVLKIRGLGWHVSGWDLGISCETVQRATIGGARYRRAEQRQLLEAAAPFSPLLSLCKEEMVYCRQRATLNRSRGTAADTFCRPPVQWQPAYETAQSQDGGAGGSRNLDFLGKRPGMGAQRLDGLAS